MSSVRMQQSTAVPLHAGWNQYLEAERDRAPGDYISDWLRQGAAISSEYASRAFNQGAAISSEYANRAYITSTEYAPVAQDWIGRQAAAGYDATQYYVPIIGEWTQQQAMAGFNAAAQYACSCQPENPMETSPTHSETLPMSPHALAERLTCSGAQATLPELRSSTPSRDATEDSEPQISTSPKSFTPVILSTRGQPARSLEMPSEQLNVDSEDLSDAPVERQTSAHVVLSLPKSSSTPDSGSVKKQPEVNPTLSKELPTTNPEYDGLVHATSADSVLLMPSSSTPASLSNDGHGAAMPEKASELPSLDPEIESSGPVHSITATSLLVMPAPSTPVSVSNDEKGVMMPEKQSELQSLDPEAPEVESNGPVHSVTATSLLVMPAPLTPVAVPTVGRSVVISDKASKQLSLDPEGESNAAMHTTTETNEHSVSTDGLSAGSSKTSGDLSSTKPQVRSRRRNIPDAPSPVKQTRCMCLGGK